MYFDSYEACLRAAITQSKGQLGDTKLYVKCSEWPHTSNSFNDQQYRIGFTPDNLDDAYIYNGLVYSSVKDGEGIIFKCRTEKEDSLDKVIEIHNDYCSKIAGQ